MRFTVFVLLLSSLVFAQDPGQQASQIAVQQAQQAQERASQIAIQQTQQAQQQAMQATQQAALNASLNSQVPSAPSFSPKPGTFQGVIPPVTITDGTKSAVIYFTTDGSTPTHKSQRYTGPISLSATTTLKAIAIAPSSAQSRTARGKYVVK
jgi:hypothetical protein